MIPASCCVVNTCSAGNSTIRLTQHKGTCNASSPAPSLINTWVAVSHKALYTHALGFSQAAKRSVNVTDALVLVVSMNST